MDSIAATSAISDTSMQMMGDIAVSQSRAMALHPAQRSLAQIDKASKDFEGMFMSQMLEPMFKGLSTDGTFGGGHGEEVMRSMLVQEYGKIASKRGGIGIADSVKREMIRAQNIAQGKDPNAPIDDVSPAATAAAYKTTQATHMVPLPINLIPTATTGGINGLH